MNTLAARLLSAAALTVGLLACGDAAQTDRRADAMQSPHGDARMPYHKDTASASAKPATMMGIMDAMMQQMHGMKATGDADCDFAQMMIVHHQGAIDMAMLLLREGTDTTLRKMAVGIVSAQQGEIAEMRRLLNGLPAPAANPGTDEGAMMQAMMGTMRDDPHPSGDVDKDFARMMIPHHESAVAMAKVELQQGRHAELKQMAQKMIDDQTREIGQFKSWLAAHP